MTTVTLYIETLKESELAGIHSDQDLEESEVIIEENLKRYIEYVRGELKAEGFDLEVDAGQDSRSYYVEADSVDDETKAHSMMSGGGINGFWEWWT